MAKAKSTKPVSEELIKSIEESETPVVVEEAPVVKKVEEPKTAVVSTGGSPLTFRGENSSPIGVIADGETVTVVKKSAKKMAINSDTKTMTEVIYNGTTGFVSQDYLKF